MKKLLIGLLLLSGCQEAPPVGTEKATKRQPPSIATPVTHDVTAKAKPVIQRACWQCHAQVTPAGTYHAGVEVHPGNPWTLVLPSGMDPTDVMHAIGDDRAPAHRVLTAGERDTLTEYLVYDLGASTVSYTVPSTFGWHQNTHQTGLTIPGNGYQAGGYTAFAVEFFTLPNLYIESYTEDTNHANSEGHPGPYTKTVLKMDQYVDVPYDSFTSSNDATKYVMPAGVAYNGRLINTHMHGYVQINKRFFVGMHVQEDKRGPTNSTRRDSREYVRFQIEGGSTQKIGLRMKKRGYNDEVETVGGWEDTVNNPGPSDLVADSTFSLLEDDFVGSGLFGDVLYWYEFYSYLGEGGMHYRGELWTDNPNGANGANAVLKAKVGGVRASWSNAWGGFFIGDSYERNSTGKSNRIADTEVIGYSMKGAGTGQGGCRFCELDR